MCLNKLETYSLLILLIEKIPQSNENPIKKKQQNDQWRNIIFTRYI